MAITGYKQVVVPAPRPNMKKVRLAYAAFNNQDIDGLLEFLHPDIEVVGADENGDEVPGQRFTGKAGVAAYMTLIRDVLENPNIHEEELHDGQHRVVAVIRIQGILRSNGAVAVIPAVHFFGFKDGLIRWMRFHRTSLEDPALQRRH